MGSPLIQIKPQADLVHQDNAASLEIAPESAVFDCCRFDVAQTQHKPTNMGLSGYASVVCMTCK